MTKLPTFIILLLLVSTDVFGQNKSKVTHKTSIDIATVSHGDVYKLTKAIEDSTFGTVRHTLTTEQIKKFVDEWNNASYSGVCKFKPRLFIDLYFKDGSIRTFRINGTLKEKRDYCYTPLDKSFFKTLWKNSN